eukprot:TRINITY_DN4827_c0_g2_i3.p2 TRINITY_DN4827_c0_g2~~TRINITY_DN4827_c0_g2_i3.p2  ORF type:complete len:147 (-),score=27.45 TRINITY_DN4827_c0_g2_i3:4-444(-)
MFPAMLPVFFFMLVITRQAKRIYRRTLRHEVPGQKKSLVSRAVRGSTFFLESTVGPQTLGHIKPNRKFFVQFFLMSAALAVVLLNYYYCQLFTLLYMKYAKTEGLKVGFAIFFPFSLLPFSGLFRWLLKRSDEGVTMSEGFPGQNG